MFRLRSVLFLLAIFPLACFRDDSPCGIEVIAQLKSPDGLRTAYLFQRDCGATTTFTTQVSVLRGEVVPSEAGNVFVATSGAATPETAWGGPPAEIRWIDSLTLEVSYYRTARTYAKAEAIDGVSIRYVLLGDA